MRHKIWNWLTRNVPEGCYLPRRLIAARAMLYPIETVRWMIISNHPYQPLSDTWVIHGVRYSGLALLELAKADGQAYRICRVGDVVQLERLHNG